MNTYFKIETFDLQANDWHEFEFADASIQVYKTWRVFRSAYPEIAAFCRCPNLGIETTCFVKTKLSKNEILEMIEFGMISEMVSKFTKIAQNEHCAVGLFEDKFETNFPKYTKDFKTFAEAREYLSYFENTPTTTWKMFIWADTGEYDTAEVLYIF